MHTTPDFNVICVGLFAKVDVSTKKDTVALEDFLDLGTYPIFRARDTTFSLSVAESMNTSLDTMLALYEVI